MQTLRKIIRNSKGATAIEYGLIAALIAVAAITAMTSLGGKVGTAFNNVSDNMKVSEILLIGRTAGGGGPMVRRPFYLRVIPTCSSSPRKRGPRSRSAGARRTGFPLSRE
jgi:pilus assembly protein Flp/PilA